jgi:chromosome segregation ATPase
MANIITKEDIDSVRSFAAQWRGVLAAADALEDVVDIVQHKSELEAAIVAAQEQLITVNAGIAAAGTELAQAQQAVQEALQEKKSVEDANAAAVAEAQKLVRECNDRCAERERALQENLGAINDTINAAREELAVVRKIIADTKASAIAAIAA